MENFEYIETLVGSQDYKDLSAKDKELIDAEIGQEQYTELRQGILRLQGERLALKQSRDKELLNSWNPKRKGMFVWLTKPLPAYSHLIVLLLFGILYWLTPPKKVTQTQIAEKEVPILIRDTIRIVQIDTLWRERVVRIPGNRTMVNNVKIEETTQTPQIMKSKSIAEQEDLLDLVVRGK